MDIPVGILGLLLLALVALAWGDALLKRLEPSIHGLQRFVIAQALGFALLGFLVQLVGWIAWTPVFAWLLLIALAVPGLARGRLGRYREKLPVLLERYRFWIAQLTRLDRALLISLGVIFGLFFLMAFSPLIGWDAATHHYVMPTRYLAAGKVVPVKEIIFGNYPALIHSLYAWSFAIGGLTCTALLNWYVGVLLAILIYSYGRTLHSRTAGLVAAITFFASPTMSWIVTAGYVDLYMVLFLLAALIAWEHRRRESLGGIPWLPGVLIGCALGTKHLAVSYALLFWAARLLADRLKRTTWIEVAQMAGIALLLGSPWYIRSWIYSGNPIDPFLPGLLVRDYAVQNPVEIDAWSQPTERRNPWMMLLWPWRFVMDFYLIGSWFRALMPLPLALLPLPLLLREARYRTPVLFYWLIVIGYALFAVVLVPGNTRYALAAWGVVSWLTGMVAGELALRPLWRLRLFPILLGLPILLLTLILVKDVAEGLPARSNRERLSHLMTDNFPGYEALAWANDHLPEDARVLSLDPRVYFLDRYSIVSQPGNESHLAPAWSLTDTHQVLAHLRAEGITHIIANNMPMFNPLGTYLYEWAWHLEHEGLVVGTPQLASEWSGSYELPDGSRQPYMDVAETRRYMDITRMDILPNADGEGHPGGVVKALWARRVIGGNRLPLMQGHMAAMQPILIRRYSEDHMVIYEIDWEAYESGTPIDEARTLTWLLQHFPMPPEIEAKIKVHEEQLAGRVIPYGEYLAQEQAAQQR